MSKVSPSRQLNSQTGFMGLTPLDLIGLGYGLIIMHSILTKFDCGFVAFPVMGGILLFIIGIRLRSRPKIIRDFFKYYLLSKTID